MRMLSTDLMNIPPLLLTGRNAKKFGSPLVSAELTNPLFPYPFYQ